MVLLHCQIKFGIEKSFNAAFYEKLVNSQVKEEYRRIMDKTQADEPLAQAFNGGTILKQMMGDKWEGSTACKYIQSLLSHFQDSSAFDLHSIENDVLSSFAAFCQKGDNIDRLSEYLASTGFGTLKLAYGIYGATRGFSSLPKTFTTSLIDGDKEYFKRIFCEIYTSLFGVDLKNVEYPALSNVEAGHILSSGMGGKIIASIDTIEPKKTKRSAIVKAVSQASDLEDAVQSPKAFMYILDSIISKNTNAYKALKRAKFDEDTSTYTPEEFRTRIYSIVGEKDLKSQKEKIDEAIELESKRQDGDAFLKILDNFLRPGTSAYKKIAAMIQPTIQEDLPLDESTPKPVATANPPIKRPHLIIDDPQQAYSIVEKIPIDDPKLRNQILDNFKYLINGYQPGGYYRKDPETIMQTNKDIIDHFVRWCLSKKNYNKIKWTSDANKELEKVKKILTEHYPN